MLPGKPWGGPALGEAHVMQNWHLSNSHLSDLRGRLSQASGDQSLKPRLKPGKTPWAGTSQLSHSQIPDPQATKVCHFKLLCFVVICYLAIDTIWKNEFIQELVHYSPWARACFCTWGLLGPRHTHSFPYCLWLSRSNSADRLRQRLRGLQS